MIVLHKKQKNILKKSILINLQILKKIIKVVKHPLKLKNFNLNKN